MCYEKSLTVWPPATTPPTHTPALPPKHTLVVPPYTHTCPTSFSTPRMFKAKLFMKVIRRTKTGISVRKEKRRLPILGVSLFFPRWSSSLRWHYFLIFDPDVIYSYLLWRKQSRKDGKDTGKICLSNLTGSGDENRGRNPRFHRLLCFEQQLLMLIVLYSLAASNKSQVDDHSAEVGVDVIVFRSVFRAFDAKMSIKYRFNHFVKGFVTERVIKIVQTHDVTVYYIWLLK